MYVVSGEYQRAVASLAANGDYPIYPAEYHLLAVYRAMMDHGAYVGGPEVEVRGRRKYNQMLLQMEMTQLPEMFVGGIFD